MNTMDVQINIPEAMAPFAILKDEYECSLRNAMMLYPFIQRGKISHGYAAEILGIRKMDLIELYADLGLPYFTQSAEEIADDVNALKLMRRKCEC